MAVSVSKIAVQVTGETAALTSAMQRGADSIDLITIASMKSASAQEQLKNQFHRSLAPISEADALFENHIASQVMLSQQAHRLSMILDDEAESMMAVGVAAQKAAGGVQRVSSVAQQGVFAVDDFVAGFGTGGVAGGLRGAANNLSMMAMLLGTLKTQLIAVGVLAVAQIGIKLWDMKRQRELEEARKGIDALRESFAATRREMEQMSQFRADFTGIEDIDSVEDAARATDLNNRERHAAQNDLRDIASQRADVGRQLRSAQALAVFGGKKQEMRVEALQQEFDTLVQQEETLERQIGHHYDINRALEGRMDLLERTRSAPVGDDFFGGIIDMDEIRDVARRGLMELEKSIDAVLNPEEAALTDILDKVRMQAETVREALGAGIIDAPAAEMQLQRIAEAARRAIVGAEAPPDAGLFGRLPQPHARGSIGAVSTINQALAGSRNLGDAQQQTARNTERAARALERVREVLEGEGQNILHVVPI